MKMIGEAITHAAQFGDEKVLKAIIESELTKDTFAFVRDLCVAAKYDPRSYMLAIIRCTIEVLRDPDFCEDGCLAEEHRILKGLRTVEAIVVKAIEDKWKAR